MSRILYILAVNYDRKHLENFKIGLENSRKTPGFFLPKEWEPWKKRCLSGFSVHLL